MLQAHRVSSLYSQEGSARAVTSRRVGTLVPRSGYDFGDGQMGPTRYKAHTDYTAGAPMSQKTKYEAHTEYQTAVRPMGRPQPVRAEGQMTVRMPAGSLRKVGQEVHRAPAPFKGQIQNKGSLKGHSEVRMVGGRLVPMVRSAPDVLRDPLSREDRQGRAVSDALNRSEVWPVTGGWAPDDSLRTRGLARAPGAMISRTALTRRQIAGLGTVESYCASRTSIEALLRGTGVNWTDDAGFRRQLAFWLGEFPEGITIRVEGASICFDSAIAGPVTELRTAIEAAGGSPSAGGGEKGGSAVISPDAVRTATTEVVRGVASTAVWYGLGALAVVGGLAWWLSQE